MTQNNLPKDWQIKKLNDVSKKLSLNKLKIKQKDYLPSGLFPVIDQGQDLVGGYYNDENLLVSDEPPYIIFGDHTKVKKYINFKFIPGADGVKVLKAKENILPKFLYYLLFTIKIEDKGYARHFQLLEKESFLIPNDIETQQAIVSKIEELFSELDKGIEDLKTAQQQLKTYRQSVLKWAFEGKLTNENVKEGELPKGWLVVRFGELFCESPQNGLYKSSSEYGEGTPIVRIDGFYDGVILDNYQIKKVKLTEEEINRYLISIGDILVNRVNSMPYLGKCGLVKHLNERTVFESNIMKIRVNKEIAIPEYISKFLTSKKGLSELRKNAKQAVNQASINQTDVSNVLIPLPQPKEQHRIVQEIESRLSVADKMEESIAQSLQQAEVVRQSILKKAFSGELV